MTILDAIPAGYVLHRPGEHGRDLNMQELLDRVRDDLHPGQRALPTICSTQILGVFLQAMAQANPSASSEDPAHGCG